MRKTAIYTDVLNDICGECQRERMTTKDDMPSEVLSTHGEED